MEEPGFWNDSNDAQEKMKELKSLESVVEGFKKLETRFEDIETLVRWVMKKRMNSYRRD